MTFQGAASQQGLFVRASGIDIHYVDRGRGEPLIVLNNGMVSTNPIWAGHPSGS